MLLSQMEVIVQENCPQTRGIIQDDPSRREAPKIFCIHLDESCVDDPPDDGIILVEGVIHPARRSFLSTISDDKKQGFLPPKLIHPPGGAPSSMIRPDFLKIGKLF